MAGHANVGKRRHLRFLIYMEAATLQINPTGTSNGVWLAVFCPTTHPGLRTGMRRNHHG